MGPHSTRTFVSTLLLPLLICLAAALPAHAQTLTTDLPDYPPGATAILTGAGFAADEPVRMQVLHANGGTPTGEDHDPWWVTADTNGGFVTSWHVCEDDCVGETLRATADGDISLLHAETTFTDANCVFFGSGTISAGGVVGLDPASCLGFLPSTNSNINTVGGYDYWLVKEGGSYQVTIDNVTECAGSNQITVVVYSDTTTGFSLCDSTTCFVADRVAGTDTFVGAFTVPDPSGGKHYFYYKCGATGSCDLTNAVRARGSSSTPTNCRGVGIRLQNFDASCNAMTFDECCSEPVLTGVPADTTVECGSVPPAPTVFPSQSCEQCLALPVQFAEFSTQGAVGTCAFTAYVVTRVWTGSDTCGNTVQATQVITVTDTTPPSIGAPGPDATIECPAAPVFTPPPGSDDCGGTAVLEEVDDVTTPGTCLGSFSRLKTWRYVDACGNASPTVSQRITVVDTTPPVIGGQGANATIECTDVPAFTPPTAADACGDATVVEESDVTTQLDCTLAGHVKYSRTKIWHAIDSCGNVSGSVSQTIDVVDTTPPAIGGQGPNATIECTDVPAFTPPTATDACSGATVVEESDVTTQLDCTLPGHVKYSRTKTWHAVDACGNVSASVSQTIDVADTTAPNIGAPGPNATIECTETPVFTPPTADDACGPATVVEESDVTTQRDCTLAGHVQSSRTKTWHAVDACGNVSASVSQTIEVADTTAPNIGAPGPNATIECTETPVFTPPTADDACGLATVVEESDVTTQRDCTLAGHVQFSRTKTWHAVDACGNVSASVSQTIDVADTTAPNIGAPGSNATIECTETPVFTPPTADDACGLATVVEESDVTTQRDCALAGHVQFSRTKTWHAVDACGNLSASVSQTIDVADTTAPVIGGQGPNATIECTETPVFTPPTATDACSGATVVEESDVTTQLDCTLAGHVKYSRRKTWYAIDGCGNASAPVSQTIDVADTTPPSLLIPADILGLAANELCAIPAKLGDPTASDNCGTVTVVNDAPALFPIGTTVVTWTATDECGNTTVGQQRVQVLGRICVSKWYDTNANGVNDKEDPIVGWKFVATNLTDGTVYIGYTQANGRVCMDVSAGLYSVTEVAPSANWVATTPAFSVTIDSSNCWAELAFGNYCFSAPGDGFTIAFWAGNVGKRYLGHNDPSWRQLVNGMNLCRADGTPFDVSTTAHPRVAIQSFQNWLLGANTTNMSYMLSAQVAATALSIQYRTLGQTQRIIVPGGVKTLSDVCIVPLLSASQPVACGYPLLTLTTSPGSAVCGCGTNDGTAMISEVIEWADCLLGAYPNTTAPGLSRTYSEAVQALLDMVNNNGNPGTSPYPCGGLSQYVHGGPGSCPFPPGY